MNPTEIEFALRDLAAKPYEADAFVFDLLGILNASKMTIGRLRSGATNKAKRPGDLMWQRRLFFRPVKPGEDVGDAADVLAADPLAAKNKPRFIIATDGKLVHIRDTKFDETEIVEFGRLDEKSDFLLPLAGYERRSVIEEHPADIKAAKKLKKLYDAILAANPTWSSGHHTHELNLLMTRLLFCFYAEKTGIFITPDVFTDAVTQHTYQDPGAVAPLLDRLFRVMNVEEKARPVNTPAVEARFPYVNGSLFGETLEIPTFDLTARRQLLECGDLDWTDINPDIFGSMIQTIAQDGTRSDLGMHYTSVPNIMKVLQPLFLDELNEGYEKAKDNPKQLDALLARLSKIRVFDPACGSGNFLVIAYKALRELETRTLARIAELQPNLPLRLSGISLQNFYGMDVVDFACETTKLSLWIAEHQTNAAFQKLFAKAIPTLPLAKITTVQCLNATREEWLEVCPPRENGETFVCGNPPYVGSANQTRQQKDDIDAVFSPMLKGYKNIDYVGCFFLRAAEYLSNAAGAAAFVTTNSICQGEQVSILWPLIFKRDVEVAFAYPSFKWQNNASNNAWVACAIVGLSPTSSRRKKMLYHDDRTQQVSIIGPYLAPGTKIIVERCPQPINGLPPLVWGSKPVDGGHLILSPAEAHELMSRYPQTKHLVRRYMGSEDFINHIERYCLWITDDDLLMATEIPTIAKRLAAVQKMRLQSPKRPTQEHAAVPYRFQESRHRDEAAIIIPDASSERRQYLQIGVFEDRDVASNSLYVMYSPPPYVLAVLSSRLVRIWTQTIGGHMRHHSRYSTFVHNTFPLPSLSSEQHRILAESSRRILKTRARHAGKAIAWLYNPETMPSDLLLAHQENDAYIEEHIYGRHFRDDAHRLEHLFAMYERIKVKSEVSPFAFSLLEPIRKPA